MSLYSTEGLSLFCTLPTSPGRGKFTTSYPGITGRDFAVAGDVLYELFNDGSSSSLGSVGTDGLPVSFAAGSVGAPTAPSQLAIASAGTLYVLNLNTNVLQAIPAFQFGPVAKVDYGDGFFIVTFQNSDYWQVSSPGDATTWPPLSVAQVTVYPENNVAMVVDHRYVWLFGQKKSQVYVDAGAAIFPYQVIPGALIEQGCGAPASVAKLDNSIFLLGADERGAGMVWRTSGFGLIRVSNHAIETMIQRFSVTSDAVGYGYQNQGHTFYVLRFPTANVTLVYDVATQLWHKRSYWNTNTGIHISSLAGYHSFSFGKHLVADWSSGNIYQMAIPSPAVGGGWNFVTDNGAPIRRTRISPSISTENKLISFNEIEIDMEVGLGPSPALLDGNGDPRGPQVELSWIDNGKVPSNPHMLDCGQTGEYLRRVRHMRMGQARTRNFKLVFTDPVPVRIIEGYLTATGFSPTERIAKQLAKVN